MKICLTHLTFGKDIFGGVENSIYNLAIGLIATGHKVIIYTSSMYYNCDTLGEIKLFHSKYLKKHYSYLEEDINTSIIESYSHYKSEIENELRSIIVLEKPDYILAIDHLWGILPYIDLWDIRCSIGLVFHMNYDQRLIEKAFSLPFKHFFSVSNYLTGTLRRDCKNIYEKKIYSLPNSINYNRYNKSVIMPNKEDEEIIFCNARLAPEKGIEILIGAFEKVIEERPNARLWLCSGKYHFGDNQPTLKNVYQIIENNPLLKDKIVFLPFLKWNEIPRYLLKSNLIVLPTKLESFGIAALEAMAAGIPLITTKTGNLPNLVRNSGILIEYGDVKALYQSIIAVLSDKQLASSLSKKGKKNARKYDNLVVAKKFMKIIGQS